jgi:phosphate transport system substrate-binding protein
MTTRIALTVAAAVAALVAATAATARTSGTPVTGAGSTFVAPLLSTWTPAIQSALGYDLQYSAVGSGAGIAAITGRQVDFGASDAPLTPDQQAACNGCVQIPWALSATAIAYTMHEGPAHLRLNGPVLARIFLGSITNWNDPAIAKLNPGADLPDLRITPVYRSDGSGTTYNFTDYLSAVSPQWKAKVGNSTSVQFPAGIGAKGSSGVAGVVSRTDGAVTYVDVAYAVQNHLRTVAVRNAAGTFLYPSLRRIVAAAAAFPKVPASNEMHIVDPPKSVRLGYPISTYTYAIVPTQSPHAAQLRKLIAWALTTGQQKRYTAKLLFAPLPQQVLTAAQKTLARVR